MMAQNDRVVVGIDVAKNKMDACIRATSQRRTFESSAQGRRQLISWLRKHKATTAVMEASGGYERDWAKVLREAGLRCGSSIRSGCAASPARPGGSLRTMRSMRR
jgi:transposase